MIFLASLTIRAIILAFLFGMTIGASEVYSVAFKGFCCHDGRRRYVPTQHFGEVPPWAFVVLASIILAGMAAFVAFLAFLDFSLNA